MGLANDIAYQRPRLLRRSHTLRRRTMAIACLTAVVAVIFTAAMLTFRSSPQALATVPGFVTVNDPSVSFYVSPSGSDGNPGTVSRPFRTLAQAQFEVRRIEPKASGNIAVYLESGMYRLTRPLRLTARDSGESRNQVVWSAAPGAHVVIAGSRRISSWIRSNPALNMWSAAVPANIDTRQIYVNGMRATLASGRPSFDLKRTATGYIANNYTMSHWRNPRQIDFVYTSELGLHVEPICPVSAIDGRRITMANPCWDNSNRRSSDLVGYGQLSSPAYLENAYELLRRPGQFYLDRSARRLFYIPRTGENMRTADVEAPSLRQLVVGSGTPAAPIKNVTFANLEFAYATWLQPGTSQGFSEVQAGFTITGRRGFATEGLCHFAKGGACPYGAWTEEPGNIELRYDHDITFENDRFVHLGAAALDLGNGSQDDTVRGSVFTDVSGNGIELGGVNLPDVKPASQTLDNRIIDNHLYEVAAEYHGGVAILAGYCAETIIAHNQIDHIPYTAISMGWGGWGDKIGLPAVPNYSHDNVIGHNRIFDFLQTLADGGGVYTQGITGRSMASGEHVVGNVIYDQFAWGRALQSDDGATFITYRQNVMVDDNYDYGDSRFDAALLNGRYDHQLVEDNFWQQGDLTLPETDQRDNHIIAGLNQAPAGILSQAGVQAPYQYTLWWRPGGEGLPGTPDQVAALYAFGGRAWITWHPAVWGAQPNAYEVTACPIVKGDKGNGCGAPGTKSVSMSFSRLIDQGYTIVSGLKTGARYDFVVTAKGRDGSSSPSIASAVQTISNRKPTLPGKPSFVGVQAGRHNVRVMWWPPTSIRCTGPWWAPVCRNPVLAYAVRSSAGRTYMVTGLRGLIVWNKRGRTLHVIGGLSSGKSYRFSVAAVTPAGVGPSLTSSNIKPLKD